ncbi:MAG: ABC transporter permease, partial [Planctomycetia bacterium]
MNVSGASSPDPSPSEPTPPARRFDPWRLVYGGRPELGLCGVVLFLGLVLAIGGGSTERVVRDADGEEYLLVENKFLNVDRLLSLAKNTSFFAVMAIGATIVLVAGGVDLSVGGIYVLSGLAGAALLHAFGPTGPWSGASGLFVVPAAVVVCLAVGAVCGLCNGMGVVTLGLHPFLVTLGTMSIFRGVAFLTTKAQSIGGFHPAFVDGFISRPWSLGDGPPLYPVPLVLMTAAALAGGFFLQRTTTGRKIHAVGGNETAARYSGLPVERLKVLAFVLSGLTAGVAAMINIGYYGSA